MQSALDESTWTFRYSTGTPGHYQYAFFLEDKPIGCVPLKDGAYIKGKGGFTVGPGSIHPNGRLYGLEIRYARIASVTHDNLMKMLGAQERKPGSHSTQGKRTVAVADQQINDQADQLLDLWIRADHRRHDLTLALVGFYERRGWTLDNIQAVVDELIEASGKGHEHSSMVASAFHTDRAKWGLPMIMAIEKEVSANAH